MNNFIKELSDNFFSLHRYSKRAIAIITDASLCILCTWLAFYLRLEKFITINNSVMTASLLSISLANNTNTQTISTQELTTGVYIIKLKSGNNLITKKLIIK